jgi:prepilin-type N-terminal cleavage/methylation domain-containing protein
MTRTAELRHTRGSSRDSWIARRRGRRGMTLIEMLVVVTGAAVMLGLCVVTLQLLLRLETDARAKLTATSAIDRLAGEFRADVHAATEAKPGLLLTIAPTRLVSYKPTMAGLIRTETEAGKTVRRDEFSLGSGLAARFEVRDGSTGTFVALMLERGGSDERKWTSPGFELLALLGKDQRGTTQPKGSVESKGTERP